MTQIIERVDIEAIDEFKARVQSLRGVKELNLNFTAKRTGRTMRFEACEEFITQHLEHLNSLFGNTVHELRNVTLFVRNISSRYGNMHSVRFREAFREFIQHLSRFGLQLTVALDEYFSLQILRSLGRIANVYILGKYVNQRYNTAVFTRVFDEQMLHASMTRNIGFLWNDTDGLKKKAVWSYTDFTLIIPRDRVSIATTILNTDTDTNALNTNVRLLSPVAPMYAYLMRKNRTIYGVFVTIHTMLDAARRFRKSSVWSWLPRDVFRYIFTFVALEDWRDTISVVKDPKWAKDTVREFKGIKNSHEARLTHKRRLVELNREHAAVKERQRNLPKLIEEVSDIIALKDTSIKTSLSAFKAFKKEQAAKIRRYK